ncbi:hypothetical protein [Flavobacterium davisii]
MRLNVQELKNVEGGVWFDWLVNVGFLGFDFQYGGSLYPKNIMA